MFRSESLANISAAMAKAFPEISNALKTKVNPHLRSKYADLSSVMDAVKPALQAHGLWFMQHTHDRGESTVCIETIIFHASGEFISSGYVSVPVTKADAHGFGSAMSYARRYSLSSCFGVSSEDDDGHAASKAAPKATAKAVPVEKMLEAIQSAGDMTTLTVAFNAAVKAVNDDKVALESIREAAKLRKAELA
jgi:hypothetical protein